MMAARTVRQSRILKYLIIEGKGDHAKINKTLNLFQ